MKKVIFYVLMISIPLLAISVLLLSVRRRLEVALRPHLVEYLATNMPESERERIYTEMAASIGSFWDVAPEPLVGRLAKRNMELIHKRAEVKTNNAGMRSSVPYKEKGSGEFRIVCLGDSFVFGTGGREEDRFCDQLTAYYRNNKIKVAGKRVETMAVGLGSWTAVQEAAYLSSRLSSYDPDIILVLTVRNDITDNSGVTGAGFTTNLFSPEYRLWGSGVFSNTAGASFGTRGYTALTTDLSPEAELRWEKAFRLLNQLVELQHRRAGKVLLSVLNIRGESAEYFQELYKHYAAKIPSQAPYIVTSYFPSPETKLPHDSHPNRLGHRILRDHYVHMLHSLGWIVVDNTILPELDERLSLKVSPRPDLERLDELRRKHVRKYLKSSLDFERLSTADTFAFLGGLFPERRGKEGLSGPPWASVRSAFLLRGLESGASGVEIEFEAPPLVELFPLSIELHLDGALIRTYSFPEAVPEGHYTITAHLPAVRYEDEAVEVLLIADKHFATIGDPRMRSFRLLKARVR